MAQFGTPNSHLSTHVENTCVPRNGMRTREGNE